MDKSKVEQAVEQLIAALGFDQSTEGLRDTPARVTRAFEEMLSGYSQDPAEILNTTFDVDGEHLTRNNMVMLRDVSFTSMCEHHLLPFTGVAHVAYLPGDSGRVVGISKLARVVDCFARRLQLQERMTWQIANSVQSNLDCSGCLVVVEAEHACMTCRGVNRMGSSLVSTAVTGVFSNNAGLRSEVMQLLVERNHR